MVEASDETSNKVLENKDNDFKIKIAKNIKNKRLVVIRKDKYEISWGINKAAASMAVVKEPAALRSKKRQDKVIDIRTQNLQKQTVENLSSAVEFSDVYPNIDLQYNISSEMLKENFIIKNKVNNPILTFNLEVKNLIPVIQQDNSIIFYDDQNTSEVIFKIDPPNMYDSTMSSSKNIKMTLNQQNKNYILTLIPDNSWINDTQRLYPIIIDPTIKTAQETNSIVDSYVSLNYPTTNYKNETILKVGNGNTTGITRSFIKFSLPTDKLKAGDLVIGARLNLKMALDNYDKRQINVYKVTQDWSSGSITWANSPSVEEGKIQDYQVINGALGSWVSWDITKLVKEWISTGINYGVTLRNSNESVGYNQFYSSDVSDYDEAGNNISVVRPVITIDYINNSGLENYWTYHSQDVGRAGSGYVNDFNGNLVFIHNDLAMTGSKMPLAINHVFNSNDRAVNLGYGYGWRLNLNQRIEADSIGDMQYYIYTDEDGTKHYFYYDNSSETYQQQMGVDLTFNKNSDGSYTITDKEGGRLEFVVGGYLYKIKDKNDNTITLSYDGTVLKSITDGAGRVTKLDVLSNGYLVGIIDPGGQRTSFAYNGQQLSQITYPDGKYTLFTYDSKNNLQNAKNYDSYNINYDYYPQSPYRVKTIKEFGTDGSLGGSLDIKYGYNTTTFTDMNKPDRINIYQFNDYGMTISIKNSDESAEIYKYNNEKKNLYNKLSAASRMQKFSKNYLKNHGAESEELYWTKGNWMGIEPKNIDGKFTTEEAYMGQKSLKMTKSDESSRDFYQQWVTGLEIGKAYVFSAYIKTVGITKLNNKGAALFITYKDSSGVYNSFESTCIQGTNDWVRHDFSFTLPSNADTSSVAASVGIIQEKGTAYFDCMQLEEGNIPSRYNLVENADFSYSTTDPSPWIKGSETDTNDVVSPNSGGKSAYKIAGVVGKKKNVYQKLYISGKAGDGFIVSAWAMANLAAPSDSSASNESARLFALGVGFQTSATENDWFVVPFNEDVDTWQYVSDIIVAKKDYTQITIYGEYYNNINNAYFTDFQLYKEEYGASYEYDDKGNVKAIQSLAKERSSFVYDNTNNTLTSATMPNNGTYEYKYDTKRNLTKATSATKVLYSFDYDSSGNPLKSRVGDPSDVNVGDTARLFMESTGNYSTSGNYLKAQIDNEENSVISHYNEGKGILAAITDGKGSKTFHNYDDMNRLTSVYKILGDSGNRNLEKFPLSTSLVGSKGTRTIFDAGINLLENSSFENGTNPIPWKVEDWNGSTGKWRVVSGGVNGNYCLESYDSDGVITGQATNAVAYQLVTLSAALAVNKIYTLSTYSKRTGSANPALAIQCFDINGAQIAGSYQNNVNTIPLSQWTRISNSFNVPAGTKSFFVILRSSVSGTDTISFDAVQMEENNAATTYSLSRSDNSKPYYDLGIDKKSGTMSIWFNTTGTGTRMIFSNENSLTLFNLYIDSQNKVILNAINKAGTAQNIITVGDMTIANSTWYFIALRWQLIKSGFTSTLQCTLYVNNKAYNGSVTDFRDFTGLVTALGSNQSGNYSLSGTLDNFAYSRNALSNEDINLLYNKTMPDDKGTVVTNSYSYENDRIKKVTHNGFSYNFEYDNFGNNNKVYVENQLLITNKFDPATDNLMSSEYGNNQRISMTYDEFDRITERKFNKDTTDGTQTDVSRYTYAYNNEGNLAYHEDKVNNKNYKYTYDLSDRLVKVDEINNEIGSANYGKISSTKFGYDMSNNGSIMMEKIDEKLYETRYGYDKDNRATGVFYDPVVEDISSFEYFHLTENTIGSKGKVPETETPVFRNDENYEPALYAYPGTKVVYDLGINKNYGTMTAWVNTRNNTGSRMIIGNEGTGKLFNLYIDGNQKVNLAVINNNGSFTNLTTSDEALRYNTWYFVAMSWQFYPDSSTLDCTLYVNDRIYKFKTADFKDFTGLKTSIGSNISGDYSLNGLIRNFNYSSSTLTEGEILSMYTNKSIRYSYDKLGRLEKKTINIGRNGFETQYGYVSVGGKEQGATLNKLSVIQNELVPINYEYDSNGNITRIFENGKEILYYYNELNELIQEDNQVLNKTVIYSYNTGGNIVSKRDILYGVPTALQPSAIDYIYDNVWKDKLISYNKNLITYDAIGNPKTYNGDTYTWEEGRRLVSIQGNNKYRYFKYNDAGIRTEKNVDGVVTKYHLVGDRVTCEYNDQDRIYYRYDNANDLVSMNVSTKNVDGSWQQGVEYYYIRNGQGDIIALIDNSKIRVANYAYDSWGKLISIKDQNGIDVTNNAAHVGYKNPYRYRGYRYDSETGLYYLNSRYYNPEWGRYLNADVTVGSRGDLLSHNVFAYAKNNCVNMTDSNGYLPRWVKWAVAAVVAVVVVVAVVALAAPEVVAAAVTMGTAVLNKGAQVVQRVGQRAVQVASRVSQSKGVKVVNKGVSNATSREPIIVTEDIIRAAMKDAPLKTQQGAVNLPAIQRYVTRLEGGEIAPAIKVDNGIIVDGNHRYIAGRIFGKEPLQVPGAGGRPNSIIDWSKLKIDPFDWGNK